MRSTFSHEQKQRLSQSVVELARKWLRGQAAYAGGTQAVGATSLYYNEWIVHVTRAHGAPLHLWMNLSNEEVEVSTSVLVYDDATHKSNYVPPSQACDWCKYGSGYPYPTNSKSP